MSERTTAEPADADRVVVSYPADFSDWGRQQVDTEHFRSWLRKKLDAVSPGDTLDAFVGVGCCGDTLDVPLRLERVDGGDRVGPDTTVVYEVREACDLDGGWQVQSEAGPAR